MTTEPTAHLAALRARDLTRSLCHDPELLTFTPAGARTHVARGEQVHTLMYGSALKRNPVWLLLGGAATLTLGTLGPARLGCPVTPLLSRGDLEPILTRAEDARYRLALRALNTLGSLTGHPAPVILDRSGLRARTPRGLACLTENDDEDVFVIRLAGETLVPLGNGLMWRGVPAQGSGRTVPFSFCTSGVLRDP